ncbi:hypothetical protein AB6A40_008493 [Gnathostoma spinigerum]|uniref:Calmodulin n=1 Tax=Gnathostoma spinigerum TaxID=75299 RepID=A0ABD6EWZ4_9BILA
MRCLGYCPTTAEAKKYFTVSGGKIDFPSFLEILYKESEKGDPLIEVHRALQCMDRKRQEWITVPEFVSILSSIGEKMSPMEVSKILAQCDISDNRVHYSDILKYLVSVPLPYQYSDKLVR